MKSTMTNNTTTNENITIAEYQTEIMNSVDTLMTTCSDEDRAQALLEVMVGMNGVPEIGRAVIQHHRNLYLV